MKKTFILPRIIFLGLFSLAALGIFWMSQSLSNLEQPSLIAKDGFIPAVAGEVVLVEYSDFQCPACGAYYPFVKQLKSEFSDKLTVVYKHFPLKSIHKNADLAARAAEASLIQDKFWEVHNKLFETQKDWSSSSEALSFFTDYAVALGLDKEAFLRNIESSAVKDKVITDYREGISVGVRGTPTFFLNGKKINNPTSYDGFKSIIEEAIKQ